jgi:hypothetical protein
MATTVFKALPAPFLRTGGRDSPEMIAVAQIVEMLPRGFARGLIMVELWSCVGHVLEVEVVVHRK